MRALMITALLLVLSAAPVGTDTPQGATSPSPPEAEPEALEEFVPSEQVRADNEVSFPVDI